MGLKVLYLANIPAPYAVEYFAKLGELCQLTVVYERRAASNRNSKWISDTKITYSEIFLKGRNIGTENSWCPSVVKYLNSSYDAIIIGTYSSFTAMWAIWYLYFHKIPYIVSSDGGFIAEGESSLKRKLKTFLIGNASGWISSGEKTNEYLKYYGAKEERICIYPFTSLSEEDILRESIADSAKREIREQLKMEGKKVFVGVGQFIHRKGWDVLVKAVKLLNNQNAGLEDDVHFYIIGGSREAFREEMEEEGISIKDIPSNIHTIDFCDRNTVFNYYKAADAFVLPTREDIWGLVVNEAMANAIPVITTDKCIAGLELIKDGINGYIVKSEDYFELSDAIQNLLRADTSKMGTKAAETIVGYTYSAMAQRTVSTLP